MFGKLSLLVRELLPRRMHLLLESMQPAQLLAHLLDSDHQLRLEATSSCQKLELLFVIACAGGRHLDRLVLDVHLRRQATGFELHLVKLRLRLETVAAVLLLIDQIGGVPTLEHLDGIIRERVVRRDGARCCLSHSRWILYW